MNKMQHRHYQLVARAIDYLNLHHQQQPGLEQLARAVHTSPYHLQRVFKEWAGLSPRQFLRQLNKENALAALQRGRSIEQTLHETGISSGGRLHDIMVTLTAMTPGEIKQAGKGITLHYGFADTPFGLCGIAWCERGVHRMTFIEQSPQEFVHELSLTLANAQLFRNDKAAKQRLAQIFSDCQQKPIKLWLKSTPFQQKVWEALVKTRPGQLLSYGQLAKLCVSHGGARAVGSALAKNPVAYLIPCHRVIRANGLFNHYRWGKTRKQAILIKELATHSQP